MKTRMRLIKIFIINLTIISATLVIFLASLELYLRLSGFGLSLTPGNYMSHPVLKYVFRPGASGMTYGKAFKINSLGLRDYEYGYTKNSGTFRILCL
ncbi:MAG: SGNH/GDSL hydrolase family protein, partial [Candidatus Omnitrophota bacterium]|nr:SGNH/GDSL hydrolase family protein [Candidatus Omnitrophota bacterium]